RRISMNNANDPRTLSSVARAISRRQFLEACGISTMSLLGAGVLAACGSGGDVVGSSPQTTSGGPTNGRSAVSGAASSGQPSTAAGTADFGTFAFQLNWIKDTAFGGEYFADSKGYYTEAGFSSVNLISGGSASNSPVASVLA